MFWFTTNAILKIESTTGLFCFAFYKYNFLRANTAKKKGERKSVINLLIS